MKSSLEQIGRRAQRRLLVADQRLVGERRAPRPRHDGLIRNPERAERRREPRLQPGAIPEVLAVDTEHLQRLALDAGHLMQPDRTGHDLLQLPRRDGLDEVTKRAVLHRPHGAFHRRSTGHEHEGNVEIVLAHGAQELESIHLGHRDVAHDDVKVSLASRGRGRLAVEGNLDCEPGGTEGPGISAGDRLFVVDQQN